ncbi:putative ribonuclease H-like domain-containing protein [Tanacetum coccineum]
MVAIDGAGFDWSFMADEEVTTNMALMAFSDSEFNLATYKRGLASVEEQLVFYKKNKVMFSDQIVVLKRDASFKDSEIIAFKNELKKEKECNQIKIDKFENAFKCLDKLIGSQISNNSRKAVGYNAIPPPPTCLFTPPTIDLSNSGIEEFQQPEFKGYGPKASKSVCVDTSNEVKKTPDTPLVEEPKAVNTARPNSAVVDAVRANKANAVKASACWVWRPTKLDSASITLKKQNYIDARGRSKSLMEDMLPLEEESEEEKSLVKMCDKKNCILFTDTACFVLSPDFKLPDESQILLKIPRKNNMYSVDMKNIVPKESLTCLVAKATLDESMLWHRRLGHVNFKTINKLVKDNLVRGLPSKRFENDQTCVACLKGKQHKASCKSKVQNSITQPLFMLHMDLFGPTFVSSLMNKKYCLVVTDDYSRFTWVFFLASKDETSGILKNFITEIENLVDKKVKIIRCDNGTEFKNRVMNEFCEQKGIKREYSVARTPQQNGVAERRNKTLIEAARTMLADSKLPTTFWAEAVNTACYVQNRVIIVKPHNKTPYELFRGRTPALSFMRPFGCHVSILNTLDHLGKFDGKSDDGFFVGYSLTSKAFRVYNIRTRKVEENLHIRFLEDKPIVSGNGPKWLFDIDSLTKSMNYVPVIAGTNSNDFAGSEVSIGEGTTSKETDTSQDYIVMPLWKDSSLFDSPSMNVSHDEPEPSCDAEKKDDEGVSKASGVDNQERPESSTPNISTARPSINTASANLRTGSLHINTVSPTVLTTRSNRPQSVSDIISLRDNVTPEATNADLFGDETEMDMSNLNASYHVPTTPNTRIHKDHSLDHVIGDIKSGVQTRGMIKTANEQGFLNVAYGRKHHKDLNTCLFFCFLSQEEPKRVTKALSSAWVEAMQEELLQCLRMDVKSAFLYGWIKEEVYVCQPLRFKDPDYPDKVYKVVKALYGLHQAPKTWYETLAKYLLDNGFHKGKIDHTLFIKKQKGDILLVQMSSMGELTFFLGLQVKQKEDGIFISQDKYVADILRKFSFTDVRTASTPIDTEKPFIKDSDSDDVDVHLYRIFKYLKAQPKLGLWYPKDSSFDLVAYSDSDYARASLDRKSTTGGCQFLGCRLISWQCKKQTVVVTSSTEAEYVAAASCCRQDKQSNMVRFGDTKEKLLINDREDLGITCQGTLDNGEIELTATIDGKVKAVIEGSGPVVQGKGSTHLVESHHRPTNAPSTSQPPISSTSRKTTRQESVVPQPRSPTQTPIADEAASTGVDVRYGGDTTTVTSLEAGQGSGNIDKTLTMPQDSPLLRVNTLGSDEGSMTQQELMVFYITLLKKVESLETDLKQTKLIYGATYTKLIMKVKKLEKTVKSSQARRRTRMVVSDDEDDLEDPSKQEMKIDKIDQDPDISLEVSTAKKDVSTAGTTTLVYIRKSAAKYKGKGKMDEFENVKTKTKLQQEQERLDFETAVRLQAELEEEERQRIVRRKEKSTLKLNKQECLQSLSIREKEVIHCSCLSSYSFDELKTLFETTMRRVNTFVPIESKVDRAVPELAVGSSKRDAEEELDQESSKRQKTGESSELAEEPRDKEDDELSQEELQQMMIIVLEQGMNVEALQTKYPIIDWEIYTEGTRNLVKEKFNSTEPTDDKEREIWVELKRLFEPDTDDELWKLQKHIHDLTWKLYDSCGVHHVSTEKGIVSALRLKDQEDEVFGRILLENKVMAISVILVSSDSSEDSVGTPAEQVILFETPIIAPTIPPSPDYTPASPDYSPASDSESDPSSDHIPPLPDIHIFIIG